jgi:uncharacterized protein (DUF1501 family)
MTDTLSRRAFMARAAAIGCSAAASPLLTRVSLADAPWDTRLVVIILRGGMDGLDVVQPYGAPDLARWRPGHAIGPDAGAADLDGFFALNAALAPLMPLWSRGELGFVHAVSTPYRDKRSHFDGQDLLEAGTSALGSARDGWLNRLLQGLPGTDVRTAYSIGHGDVKLLIGAAPAAEWSPDANLVLSPQALRLAELVMQDDPAFHAAFAEALILSQQDGADLTAAEEPGMVGGMPAATRGAAHLKIAEFAADRLRDSTRIAAFSLNGWDTHRGQAANLGRALTRLSETILTLRDRSGPDVWQRTAVLAMTEFGRTVRLNGTAGTDHGTGGAMLLAGGAIRGGRVLGDWPGLDEAALYDRRDLMPTDDLRRHIAWALHGLTGAERNLLERQVFPGVEMGADPGLLL